MSRKSEKPEKKEKKRDQKYEVKEVVRLKNGKCVQTKKGKRTIFIQILSETSAGLYFHKFFDPDLQRMLEGMNHNIYNNFSIKYDKIKKMFIIPRDSINTFFERLDPYARKKKLNLISVPNFVYRFLDNADNFLPPGSEKKTKKI